jgi:alginate O-acetyltransferase complex protein AlgI
MNQATSMFLVWIALSTVIVWSLPRPWQPWVVTMITVGFLGWFSPVSLALLLGLGVACFVTTGKQTENRWVFATNVAVLIFALIWFRVGSSLQPDDPVFTLVPLGFSYYALRLLHYLFDRWNGVLLPVEPRAFFSYLFFLPTLLAGPINRFQEHDRNLRRRRWDAQNLSHGLERILYGYAKIVILGNYLVTLKLQVLVKELGDASPATAAYLDCCRYGLNLYFQFAGYSDIAIGFALLLGFRIAENFNFPFLAQNINDFWRRWHISLSAWCRDYVYMFVVSWTRNPRLGVLLSMLVLGLWHELSWRYLLWGIYHGAGIAVWQRWQTWKRRFTLAPGRVARLGMATLSWAATMHFVLFSFALTKEPDLSAALEVYQTLFFGWR